MWWKEWISWTKFSNKIFQNCVYTNLHSVGNDLLTKFKILDFHFHVESYHAVISGRRKLRLENEESDVVRNLNFMDKL